MDFADQLKVIIDPIRNNKAVYVPKKLIIERSSYFRKGCEATEYAKHGYVNLTSTSLEEFSSYLHVLHFDEVGIEDGERNITDHLRWFRLVALYLLAERVGDPSSMNIIMDAMMQMTGRQSDLDLNSYFVVGVYTYTIDASHPLKRLVVDLAVQTSSFLELSNKFLGWECEFTLDVARAFAKKRDGEDRKLSAAPESKNYHVAVEKA